jgi:hypothetical protein
MNNGTLGPMPRVVFDANERYMREIMEDPTNSGRAEEIDKVPREGRAVRRRDRRRDRR